MKNWPANYLCCEQGSIEWLNARKGKLTASRVGEILGRKRDGNYYQKRLDYQDELIAEIMTGIAAETYVTAEMQFGIDHEHEARGAYEAANEVFVDRVGFVSHPFLGRVGASPDGLIGKDGGLEIKIPKTVNHLRWRKAGIIPAEHRPQMLLNMDCCEREWWDFLSFDPRLNPEFKRFQLRLYRTKQVEIEIQNMRDEITTFLEELADELMLITDAKPEQSIEHKLRESIKQARGKYPTEDELGITAADIA